MVKLIRRNKMKCLNLFILLLACICLSCTQAQEESAWKDTLENMSYQDIQAITFFDGSVMHNIALEHKETLWKNCNNMVTLESPLCRCYPSVQGRLFFFLSDNTAVMVEIADNHWVQGIFMEEGRSIKFLLMDKENKLGEAVEKAMKATEKKDIKKEAEKPVNSEAKPKEEAVESSTSKEMEETEETLCPDCQNKMFALMMGTCSSCGEMTSSCGFQYCQSCARKKGVCQACGQSLK